MGEVFAACTHRRAQGQESRKKALDQGPVSGDHSPAPCFSRSEVELAGPELSFDSSVGSETKIQLVIKTRELERSTRLAGPKVSSAMDTASPKRPWQQSLLGDVQY